MGEEDQTIKSYDNSSSTENVGQRLDDLDLVAIFASKGWAYVDLNGAGEIVLHAPNGDIIKVIEWNAN